MDKKKLVDMLEDLIKKGQLLEGTAKPVFTGSPQKSVDDRTFYGWKARCIFFIEKYFPSSVYLQHFNSVVKSTLLPSTSRGLEILKQLKDGIEQGELDDYISIERRVEPESDNYVSEKRIKEIANLPKDEFDTTKLVELCNELNQNYRWRNYFAVGALLRTILDHVPPIFEKQNFEQVASDYSWGKSHKSLIMKLCESAKKIAHNLLHAQIRKREVLPQKERVDFRAEFDILLAEIVTIIKTQAKAKNPPSRN